MRKKWQAAFLLVFVIFVFLTLLTFVFNGTFHHEFLGKWGALSGFLLLLAALPFHSIVFFGGRGAMGSQSPEIPPDEHLNREIHKHNQTDRKFQDVLAFAGLTVILISFFLL
jgi:hypothetical protein